MKTFDRIKLIGKENQQMFRLLIHPPKTPKHGNTVY
jgi:hypothetical protein